MQNYMKTGNCILLFIGIVIAMLSSCESSYRVTTKDGKKHYVKYFSFDGLYFVKLNDTLYACDIEITNARYKRFLCAIANDQQKYDACMADTNVWKNYAYADTVLTHHYWQHKAFDEYPVVGVTWEAANEFCRWMTRKAEENTLLPPCTIRLPTEDEWKLMVVKPDSKGMDLSCPQGFDTSINCYCFNFYVVDTVINEAQDGGYFTVRSDAYWPNSRGLFNVHGNVAEMTTDKNVCKGGGWRDSFSDCAVHMRKKYILPSGEVGFRIVAIRRE